MKLWKWKVFSFFKLTLSFISFINNLYFNSGGNFQDFSLMNIQESHYWRGNLLFNSRWTEAIQGLAVRTKEASNYFLFKVTFMNNLSKNETFDRQLNWLLMYRKTFNSTRGYYSFFWPLGAGIIQGRVLFKGGYYCYMVKLDPWNWSEITKFTLFLLVNC